MLGERRQIISTSFETQPFIAMATAIKSVADEVPPGQTVFFRSLFAMPVILVWLAYSGHLRDGLITKNPLGHVWRGLVGTIAMGCMFAALGLLPLPEVTAIGYASPLLVVIFAAMFLGEQVRFFRISAVVLGMVGVLIIIGPRLSVIGSDQLNALQTLGVVMTLAGATFAALAQIFVRKLITTESTPAIVFYFSLTATLLSLVTVPFGWVMPNLNHALLLVMAGLAGGVGQILLTNSYRHADASVIAPFEYSSMLLAIFIGMFLFDEVPTPTVLAGAFIVVLAGLLIIWRERQLGIARSKARSSMTP
ncbi:MAG: DMT family transporter [Paracoccaceae bacterium]